MKKRRILSICLLVLLIPLIFGAYENNRNSSIGVFHVNSTTKEEITEELITALFIEEIRRGITGFYSEYYSGDIAVYNYEVIIVDIGKKEPGLIFVDFGVTPQIGAHNPLGYDELSYNVDSLGNKSLAEYKHLKSYDVPEKFHKYIIKTLE